MNLRENQASRWSETWTRALSALDGVTRRRVEGGAPGVEIALLDWGGEGDLIVLHHANGFCGASLAPIANALRHRYRVVAVDARGHGDSSRISPSVEPDAYAWQAMSADLRSALRQVLEIADRDRVELAIGHSFGGALILDSAEREPALFGRALLCDPVILQSPTPSVIATPSRGPDLAAGARKRRSRFPSRAEAFAHFQGRGIFADFTPEALALYVGEGLRETSNGEFVLKCDPEVEAAIFSSGALADLFEHAHRATADVVFLHALGGNFSRQTYDDLAARLGSARVESIERGHLFPMEDPDLVVAMADGMLAKD